MRRTLFLLILLGTMGMLTACNAGTSTGVHTANDPSGQTTAATISTTMPPASTDAPTTASSSGMEPPGTLPPITTGTIFDPDVEESYSDDDSDDSYRIPYTFLYKVAPNTLALDFNTVDQFKEWAKNNAYYDLTQFLKDFSIKKEVLATWSKENLYMNQPWFSEEEIDVLYSGDAALINRTFKNSYALYDSGKLYTPYWLASKTASDYQAAGLSLEGLEKQVQFFKDGEVLEDGRVVRWVYGKRLAAIEKNVAAYRQLLGK